MKITDNTNKIFWLVFPYFALVMLHILQGLLMHQPTIFDEFGYLGRARYLSGFAHMPQDIGRYHFGYSLFLLPAFWLCSDPISIYKAIVITNSLLISSLYFGIYYILYSVFKCDRKMPVLISATCCLYPAFVLQSNLAWSENAFIPFFSFFIVCFALLLKKQSYTVALLFGFTSSFLYAIHPRALPVLPFVAIYLLIMGWSKSVPTRKALFCILVMVLTYLITRSVNDYLLSIDGRGTYDASIKSYLGELFSFSNLVPLALSAGGQLLYLAQATYGLFFIGMAYVVLNICKKWSELHTKAFADSEFSVLILIILSSSGIFLASSLEMIQVIRGDHLIYGRYNEGFLAIYIAFALLAIHNVETDGLGGLRKIVNPYILSLIILILTSIVLAGHESDRLREISKVTNLNVINILGIYPFVAIFRRFDIFIVSLISILLLFILFYAFKVKFILGIWMLISCFVIVTASAYTVFYVRAESLKQVTALASHIDSLGDIKIVSYDSAFLDSEIWLSYQYLLPHLKFKKFSSAHNELPVSRVVISGRHWKDRNKLKARLLASEVETPEVPAVIRKLIEIFFDKPLTPDYRRDQTLWILPENSRPMPCVE